MSRRQKQIITLFIFSIAAAIIAIAHGVIFDLNLAEIKRLTIWGIALTALVIFPTILLLEWLFDWNNNAQLEELEKRIKKLEEK